MSRRAFARVIGASVDTRDSNRFNPLEALRSPDRYRIPLDEPPIVASSCFWMFTIASGRMITHGTFERRRTPSFVFDSRLAARKSFARSGERAIRSTARPADTAFWSRAGIGRTLSAPEMGWTLAAKPEQSYR